MKRQLKIPVALLKDLLGFCVLGIAAGAGVGFFIFVRLGFPKESYMIGYLSGLFVVSGIKFGISLWLVRIIFRSLLYVWAQGSFCESHYHFRDMDLTSGRFDGVTNHRAPQGDPNFDPQINNAHVNSTNLDAESVLSR
jgi:hypothetical protein